jgi:nucleoside-diphosphate-sugar epimerase/putative sterol carrier protein
MTTGGVTSERPLRVAVTGSAGSLGEAVIDLLIADAAIESIVALDVAPPRRHAGAPKVRHVQADVRDASIGDAFRSCDAVLHLAFIVERTGGRPPEEVEGINVGGTQNVFRSARKAGALRVVYASSIAAYGIRPEHEDRLLTEDTPRLGNDGFYYARHKAAVEQWLDGFETEEPSMVVARLRPSIFLSERSTARRARTLLRAPLHPRLPGAPLFAQITHEDDVAEAFVLALKKSARGAFNVTAEGVVDLHHLGPELGRPSVPVPAAARDWIRRAAQRGALGVDEAWLDPALQKGIPIASAAKIRSELRWQPRFETSGDVIRAIAGRPNARASHALRWFWGPAVLATKALRHIPMSREAAAQARGFEGDINLVFRGVEPAAYRIRIGNGWFGFLEGTSSSARATVTMKTSVFDDIVNGKTSANTAALAGRVRIRGDGEMLIIAMGAMDAFGRAQKLRGAAGFVARRYARFLQRS